MVYSDEFGLNQNFYKLDDKTEFYNDLSNTIRQKYFEDYSAKGISSFMSFRYPIFDLTMFEEFKKIPCGYRFENNNIEKFWSPKFCSAPINYDQAFYRVEELLIKAIKKLELEKYTKIAITMSGGIDSSLIVALVRTIFPNRKIHTYSAGFYGDDEFEYSRSIAKKFDTVHKEKILYRDDYIGENSLLKPLILHKGEPLHPNEPALAHIEQIARKDGCEIVLCGEGADDIFGGYGQNFRMYLDYEKTEQKISFLKYFLNNYRYFSIDERKSIINKKYLFDDFQLVDNFISDDEIPERSEDYAIYFTQKFHTVGLITRGVNAMKFNKLIPAFPFIDMDLVNYVNSLPFEFKVNWKSKNSKEKAQFCNRKEISEKYDIPKFILKKIAEKYLPKKIIYRPKYGFPVPFDFWLKDIKEWDLDPTIFNSTDISSFRGWKKFMLINLNAFIQVFNKFKENRCRQF